VDNGMVQPMPRARVMAMNLDATAKLDPMQAASGDQQISVSVNITAAAMR
jgi:hypothetical protein